MTLVNHSPDAGVLWVDFLLTPHMFAIGLPPSSSGEKRGTALLGPGRMTTGTCLVRRPVHMARPAMPSRTNAPGAGPAGQPSLSLLKPSSHAIRHTQRYASHLATARGSQAEQVSEDR